ncbi:uncharacterized protein SAPINGB_P006454 [Magnusiomyces paraingens]|uniref:CoA-transferase family III n=1 Tax=Magnusiomyces paraingens TaxID=2606893 RepID=A0A5E8C5Z2_9ASCO|nr:uncharacterized protein SAPINGB_P006454 [Saprochaete ingens]VVT58927.1 unnamed protein product [Saprochaete ingens]
MTFSILDSVKTIFDTLINDQSLPIPDAARDLARTNVTFEVPERGEGAVDSDVVLPCPLKQCETVAALKAVEGSIGNAIAVLRYNTPQKVSIDLQHAVLFLFMAYLATVDGKGKLDPEVKKFLKDTDLLQAQSNLYRRMSANLYKTKDNKYFHIHGSLEADTTLKMIGLPPRDPSQTDYHQIIKTLGDAVAKYTADELEVMNAEKKQAGTTALTREEFDKTPHGQVLNKLPYWETVALETTTPPVAFPEVPADIGTPKILSGFKVVEMCRIIAGPTITRILAEYGAEVIKVTSPNLSDVPFFQVDGNMGKHTTDLDLKGSQEDRKKFEALLTDADILVDGYRTHALEHLGYGIDYFTKKGIERGKGYIYVSENCYGFDGEWAHRPGWQQIADCVTGIAWIQGKALGRDEPIIPPFPMSDYGTGCMGAIACLDAVYKRATKGGSYWAKTSLVQYDLLLMNQGLYPESVWQKVRDLHDADVRAVRYYDSVDHISGAALKSMWRIRPDIFTEVGQKKYMDENISEGFHNKKVKTLKPVVRFDKNPNAFEEVTRPNGYDEPKWWK